MVFFDCGGKGAHFLGVRGGIICIHSDYSSSKNKDKVICFDHNNHKVGFTFVSAIAAGVPKFSLFGSKGLSFITN